MRMKPLAGSPNWRRFIHLAPALAFTACAWTPGGAAEPAKGRPVVTVDSGPVRGVAKAGVDEYLGIPYAAAPVGALRWRPPVAPAPWAAPRDAAAFGATCAQNRDLGVFSVPSASEDCLFLNVLVPRSPAPAGGRPVFVWIHGGGYVVGQSNGHDGSKLAVQGGAVVVTLNYRLGALGFLAHPMLDREGHPFANYGLMDQQFALKWVKRNIRRFGGDPGNVTIAGESSGGTSVMSQLVSPGAAGLFQHAIAQSGAAILIKHPGFGAPRPLDVARELGSRFAAAAGCADQSAACLRALPVGTILRVQTPFVVNQAIIDGTVLPTSYAQAFATGHFNHVPLINGSNRDEWRWAVGFAENGTGKPMSAADYPGAITAFYGQALAGKVLARYPLTAYPNPSEAYGSAVTDSLFACTARRLDTVLARQVPVYAYEFADRTAPSYLQPTSFEMAAAHTLEIQYLFPLYRGGDGVPHALNAAQTALSDAMVGYWTGMGAAGAGRLWPAYDPRRGNYLSLVSPRPAMRAGTFADEHQCRFWGGTGLY